METDSVKASSASISPSRLSVSSPGRLLLRDDEPPPELISALNTKHHARRESYSSSFSQYLLAESLAEAENSNEESDRPLCSEQGIVTFTPPPSSTSQSTVRRILRDESVAEGRSSKCATHSIPTEPSPAIFQYPLPSRPALPLPLSTSPHIGDSNKNSLRRESSILYSSASLPALSEHDDDSPSPMNSPHRPSEHMSAKHVSCFSRIIPNVGLVLILSTIWLVILVYGEYAYPHSHSQFCNSYLPKESLLGRVVIVSNPHVAQLPLKPGLFDSFYNLRTRIDSFLSDFNMRRNYRILQDKCAPEAFIFSGTLIVASSSESSASDRPIGMIDEEAYIKLVDRWNWMFTKTEKTKFLFAPSVEDLAFQRVFNEANEVERRLLYQRFVDYFGEVNWKMDVGPYTLASIFTPALDLLDPAPFPDVDAYGHPISPLQLRSSINSQLASETAAFLQILELEMIEKRKLRGSDFSPVVLLSPVTLSPEANATCLDWSPSENEHQREIQQVKYMSASEVTTRALLNRFTPRLVVSRGVLPRCTLLDANMLQTILASISKHRSDGRPGVLVLEARNATLVAESGLSSLLYGLPQNAFDFSKITLQKRLTTPILNTAFTKSSSEPPILTPEKAVRAADAFELVPIFYDVTTYMDMKGPYLWLAFMSILGCMLSVDTSSPSASTSTTNTSDHFHQQQFATSTLIETLIAFSKFFAISLVLLMRTLVSYTCARTPLKVCIPPVLDLEYGLIQPTKRHNWDTASSPPSRTLRQIALRLQISVEILLICSIIVVPWCIFVMFHWM